MPRLAFRLFLAQGLDGLTFAVFMLAFPALLGSEQNPIIGVLYGVTGVLAVLVMKVSIGLGGAYLATHAKITRPRLVTILLAIATASGIAGAGMNVAALIEEVRWS